MTKNSLFTQYQLECQEALKSVANLSKSSQKISIDTLKLFMVIPDKVNFLQFGRYGKYSEQTYRHHFEKDFDWFEMNKSLIKQHLTGNRKAIAIDPSYIPKSGKNTPWIGYFWSGCAAEYKRGLEIMGIGVIDIDNHECMTLGSIQTPDSKTLDNMDKSLVDWYSCYLTKHKNQLQSISNIVVADAFFSKETFVSPMCNSGFNIISRFRNDATLFYPTIEKPRKRRGHPKWYDGAVDFERLDLSRCCEFAIDKGKLYGLRAYSKALKRFVSLAIWYQNENLTSKWQIYFSTDETMNAKEIIEYYRTRFQIEFCFRDAKHYAGLNNCQSTDFRKLHYHFNASFTAINLAKATCKTLKIPYSISNCKTIIHNAYMLERFICVSGIRPNTQVIDKLFKELVLFTAKAA